MTMIEAGAGVELGDVSLGAVAALGASVDSLTKHMRNVAKIEEEYQFGVRDNQIRKSVTSPSSGNFSIGLGGPAFGREWQLRRLVIGGALWSSVVAGSAILVIGSVPAGEMTPPLPDIVDDSASLPNAAFYSTRQVVLRHPNHLYVVILSPTASTVYAVGGAYADYPDKRTPLDTES
jgi:hypothetical protein